MNIIQKQIEAYVTPTKPKVLSEEKIYVYVPQATSTNAGIASFDNNDFVVTNGNVELNKQLRNGYNEPEPVLLDADYFPREVILGADGKYYYKYKTSAVHYIQQALNEDQKEQARKNIDALSSKVLDDKLLEYYTKSNIDNKLLEYYTKYNIDDKLLEYYTKNNIDNKLLDYFTKSESYSKTEINNLIDKLPKFDIKVVDKLPSENISATSIYLLAKNEIEPNLYDEYIYINNSWELLGSQKINDTLIVFKGNWDSSQNYEKNDVVTYQGSSYIATANISSGSAYPGTIDGEQIGWKTLAKAGDKGDSVTSVSTELVYTGSDYKEYDMYYTIGNGDKRKAGSFRTTKGDRGEPGKIGIVFKGEWDSSQNYEKNDVVTYQGSSYIATSDLSSGSGTYPGYIFNGQEVGWSILAKAGEGGGSGITVTEFTNASDFYVFMYNNIDKVLNFDIITGEAMTIKTLVKTIDAGNSITSSTGSITIPAGTTFRLSQFKNTGSWSQGSIYASGGVYNGLNIACELGPTNIRLTFNGIGYDPFDETSPDLIVSTQSFYIMSGGTDATMVVRHYDKESAGGGSGASLTADSLLELLEDSETIVAMKDGSKVKLQLEASVVTTLNNAIGTKQNATDNSLQTTSKNIVGAINEINSKISSANTQLQNILGV